MSEILELLKKGAKKKYTKIVLPESLEPRVLTATHKILAEKIAKIVLIGDAEKLQQKSRELKLDISDAEIFNPQQEAATTQKLANHLYERRKHKGLTSEQALKAIQEQPLYAGAALVGAGQADGMVAGCINATADVIKSALYCVGLAKDCPLVSGYFMMVVQNKNLGADGVFFFADSGVNPNPNSEQLAAIAKSTAESFKHIIGKEPKLAMLSFSTKGSAAHADVDKVTAALKIAQTKYPELLIDGELQVDAAVVPEIGQRKAPGSPVAGQANVLIFPDLDAGNIGYKLVERLGNGLAFGPILQGLAKPVNDLSRGASADDIVNVVEITALAV